MLSPQDNVDVHALNIVIYGETGAGKLAIINLVAGQQLAHTSNNALGRTFQHEQHIIRLNGMSYALWDTTGLDEGTQGSIPAALAESNLRLLLQKLANSGGIHLVIYCIRAGRFRNAHLHNYDLFYVTVCRKKVPIALVVTGLEHQQGEMESWWTENEEVLRQSGMRFDAHACVTTLEVEARVIQERRSDSQRRLRELMVTYSSLPAWKVDPSLISRVLPVFRTFFHRTSSTGKPGNTSTTRKVITCDMAEDTLVEFLPGIAAVWERCEARMGDVQYEFVRMNKHALQTPTAKTLDNVGSINVGALVFYTSTLLGGHISATDVAALRTFYEIADGQIYPVIVVLRDCDDDETARTCWADVVSRYSNIQAHLVPLPSAVDSKSDAQAKLGEMIERLCIEHPEVKSPDSIGDTRLISDASHPWWKRLLRPGYTIAFTNSMVNTRRWSHRSITPGETVKRAIHK